MSDHGTKTDQLPLLLLVEDSHTTTALLSKYLGSSYEMLHAVDGMEAWRMLEANPDIDVVITDINMPGMNGIDLVQSLRALPDCKFIPILVLTTEAGADLKQKGKSAGATGWIVKPFNPEVLLETLKKVL